MDQQNIPKLFLQLQSLQCIDLTDTACTPDGFWMLRISLSDLLAKKEILDFLDSAGERLLCSSFFDDWFLYAVCNESDFTYSLLKLREQEHDAEDGAPADGDTPGVTISFVAFDPAVLRNCLEYPTDLNRSKLNWEINRVVAHKGQRHDWALKKYFQNPMSQGAYLVADTYVEYIAALAENGRLAVPEQYKQVLQQSISYKSVKKYGRLPRFIEALNGRAGRVVCDSEYIYFMDQANPTAQEKLAILATHAGNTSIYSFAAEVEYHARFLTPLAKIKVPFFGRSIYDSAIRADMTVGDTEFEGPAPFHQPDSGIVKRQYALHADRVGAPL